MRHYIYVQDISLVATDLTSCLILLKEQKYLFMVTPVLRISEISKNQSTFSQHIPKIEDHISYADLEFHPENTPNTENPVGDISSTGTEGPVTRSLQKE